MRSLTRWTLGTSVTVVVPAVFVVVAVTGISGSQTSSVINTCASGSAQTVKSPDLTDVQNSNASAIITAGSAMSVPTFGIQIAIAVARQESTLHVLANPSVPQSMTFPNDGTGTNLDSIGLFQQRNSWGSVAVRMDPVKSADLFFTRLLGVPGWQHMALTDAAQSVQGSGTPTAYAQWAPMAEGILTKAKAGVVDTGSTGLTCVHGLAASNSGTGVSGYVNPFSIGTWTAQRTDQGVDWAPIGFRPVLAIGDGVVTYSNENETGWPGGKFIVYRLTTGSHTGLFIFVAEDLSGLAPLGSVVSAGQQIATAIPGGGSGTEWGFAAPPGTTANVATPYNGSPDGTSTSGGKAFARFLIELGAHPRQDPGPGSDRP